MANRVIFSLLLVSIVVQSGGFLFLYSAMREQGAYGNSELVVAVAKNPALTPSYNKAGTGPVETLSSSHLAACSELNSQDFEALLVSVIKNSLHNEVKVLSASLSSLFREQMLIGGESGGNKFLPVRPNSELHLDVDAMDRANQQANLIIENALDAGIWSDADNQALMKQAANLSSDSRMALISRLYGAINRQEIEITGIFPAL